MFIHLSYDGSSANSISYRFEDIPKATLTKLITELTEKFKRDIDIKVYLESKKPSLFGNIRSSRDIDLWPEYINGKWF